MLREELRTIWSRLAPFHLDWIQVEVSARCPGRCCYCPVGRSPDGRRGELMSMGTYELIEPFFSSTDLVFLQGWGEPLLHPRFWEMAHRARRAGARVGFATNGVLLNEANRRALLESGAGVVAVSLAGARPSTQDRFREGSPLDTVDANLRRLRKEKEATGAALPEIHVAYLLLAGNVEEVGLAVDLAERWGASDIVVSHLSLVLDSSLQYESILAERRHWPRALELLKEAQARAHAKGIRLRARVPVENGPVPICEENVLASCFVSASGEVSPCVMANVPFMDGAIATHHFRGREHPLKRLAFGNLRDRCLPEIWRSEPARGFRAIFQDRLRQNLTGTGPLPAPCRHCYKLFQRDNPSTEPASFAEDRA
jgi:MoaA/NifB/PqqE/SkfB family radical SAM enzyme